MPPALEPDSSSNGDDDPAKKQRENSRAEKVAALKRRQAAVKRNRLIAIIVSSIAVLAVIALVIVFVVTRGVEEQTNEAGGDQAIGTADTAIRGLQRFPDLPTDHVEGAIDYALSPPAGGNHNPVWLNCGVYTEPVPTENAVHDLEHGAVWVTYDPELISGTALTDLQASLPDTYITLSPWPGLKAPVVASAWGAQIELDGAEDPRLQEFVTAFWQSPDAPEPAGPCTGGVDAPGRAR